MIYTQKYALVQFFEPVTLGEEFSMSKWPLHVTLADIFAVNLTDTLKDDLQNFIDTQKPVRTKTTEHKILGTTPAILLENTLQLQHWHNALVDILSHHNAVFNNSEFTRMGFLPHVSNPSKHGMEPGDKVFIEVLSLVDFFPNKNWQKRKVITTFKPQNATP